MQKTQLLQLQNDLTRKKELNNFLIYTLKSGAMSMIEKQAIKKAIDCFNQSIANMTRSIEIELKKEGYNHD